MIVGSKGERGREKRRREISSRIIGNMCWGIVVMEAIGWLITISGKVLWSCRCRDPRRS